MIGKVNLNEKQIKIYLENHYKKIYGDVKISFRDMIVVQMIQVLYLKESF